MCCFFNLMYPVSVFDHLFNCMLQFYPSADEIFNVSNKSGGRSILASKHVAAHQAHKANFRTVRLWFSSYATDKEIFDYMNADFKSDTKTKEKCRLYIQRRMPELLPLTFECPKTGSKHEMRWPEDFLFQVVKNRKHEWRKQHARDKEG